MQNPQEIQNEQEYVQCLDESYAEKMEERLHGFRIVTGDEYFDAFKQKSGGLNTMDAQTYGAQSGLFVCAILKAMEQKLGVDSAEVQQIIEKEWETLTLVFPETNSKKIYLAIRDLMFKNPPINKELKNQEFELLMNYISQAMEVFAEKHFPKETLISVSLMNRSIFGCLFG